MSKACEWCNEELRAKRKDKRFCSKQCGSSAWKKTNAERHRQSNRDYVARNGEKVREGAEKYYDQSGFLRQSQRDRERREKIKQNPERLEHERKLRRARAAKARERKRREAARAVYLADPNNAAKIAAANLSRMTQGDRDKWVDDNEKRQEKLDRKARREALRREFAAQQVSAAQIKEQFGDAFDLEWSNQ